MKSGRRSDPKYELEIHWIPEDHCYVVKVPELEGCMTHGRTIQEAVAKAREVIAGYIESLKARGLPIPSCIETCPSRQGFRERA